MKKLFHSILILLMITFVSCKKDDKIIEDEIIKENKGYLDFLKDKEILSINIVGDTKYIKSSIPCDTCPTRSGYYNRIDQWTIINYSSYETCLWSDFIGVPQMDSKGNFYVGTNKSLYKLNDAGEYKLILNTGDFYFRYFAIDKLDNIWFYGENAGIAHWDHSKLTVYNSQNSILPADYYCELVVDESNTVWVASIGSIGLLKIESGKWEIIPGFEIPGFTENSYLNYPLVDNENGIWFEVYDSNAGSKFVRLKDNEWTIVYTPIPSQNYGRLIVDSRNVIWALYYKVNNDYSIGNGGLLYYTDNMWVNIDISDIDSKIITVNADDNIIYIGTEKGLFEKSK
jgi:hypothetical protein